MILIAVEAQRAPVKMYALQSHVRTVGHVFMVAIHIHVPVHRITRGKHALLVGLIIYL